MQSGATPNLDPELDPASGATPNLDPELDLASGATPNLDPESDLISDEALGLLFGFICFQHNMDIENS